MTLFHCANRVILAAFAPIAAISLRADTLLDQTFSLMSDRLEQKLPTSAAWFSSDRDSLGVEDCGLTLRTSRAASIAYFTAEGHPVMLEDGQSLVLEATFTLRVPNASRGSSVRVGLFDSGGNRISGDAKGINWAEFRSYTGYATFFELISNDDSSTYIYRRDPDLSSNLIGAGTAFVTLGDGGGRVAMAETVPYSLVLTLSLKDEALNVCVSITGEDGSVRETEFADSDNPYKAFDTIVFYGSGTVYESISFSRVKVTGPSKPSASSRLEFGTIH